MLTGAEKFKELFEKYKGTRPILLYGDPDPDGLFSLYLMTQFCLQQGITNYTYYVNEHRQHGFFIPPEKLKGMLVIAADFHIDYSTMQNLVDNDVVILSTDHHDIKGEFVDVYNTVYGTEGIIINNQYYFEPAEDRYLSGAGVFYELICSLYPQFKCNVFASVVGITLLTDIREIENEKAQEYLKITYNTGLETPYARYLIDNTLQKEKQWEFGSPKLTRNYVDFTLGPTINALLRLNKTDEAIRFILNQGLGFKVGQQYREYQKSLITIMMERVRILDLSNVTILEINDRDFQDMPEAPLSDFIGFLCNKYKDTKEGKSVLGYNVQNNKVTRASFRGKYDDIPYLHSIKRLIPSADGHLGAFGIRTLEPNPDLWTELNDVVFDLEFNHETTINIIETSRLSFLINSQGHDIARHNAYVRDTNRTYIKYVGPKDSIHILSESFVKTEFTYQDKLDGKTPDGYDKNKQPFKYVLDKDGKLIHSNIKYKIEGRDFTSFGPTIEEGLILLIMNGKYMAGYVKPYPQK